mmetsp:Transcript_27127/g.23995  ORF Transcript_27127/g.23995 Transcript_27127/m.23995 type:complete len:144 (-) Transcript_27127:1173-1604(-)
MASPSIGKKMQKFEYKVDLIAGQLDDEDYYNEGDEDIYDIESYEYIKFKQSMKKGEDIKKLLKNELEDLKTINANELHEILIKNAPRYIVKNETEFYEKARKICENSFNIDFDERVFYIAKFLTEFDQRQNRSIFVKRLIQVA